MFDFSYRVLNPSLVLHIVRTMPILSTPTQFSGTVELRIKRKRKRQPDTRIATLEEPGIALTVVHVPAVVVIVHLDVGLDLLKEDSQHRPIIFAISNEEGAFGTYLDGPRRVVDIGRAGMFGGPDHLEAVVVAHVDGDAYGALPEVPEVVLAELAEDKLQGHGFFLVSI